MVSDAQGQKPKCQSKKPSGINVDLENLQKITEEPDATENSFERSKYLPGKMMNQANSEKDETDFFEQLEKFKGHEQDTE